MKSRTKEAEDKYKIHQRKLIYIMGNCKKDYYNNILDNDK